MEVNVVTNIQIDESGKPTARTQVYQDGELTRGGNGATTMRRTAKTMKEQGCCQGNEPTVRRVVTKPAESSWWCCGATPQKSSKTCGTEEADDLFREGTLRESTFRSEAVSQLSCCKDMDCCDEKPCCKRKALMEKTYRAPTRTYRSERAPTYKSQTYQPAPTYRSEREFESSFVEDQVHGGYDENSCCSKECCDDIQKPCIGTVKNAATTYREPTYVSQRGQTFVSQREPTYASQREPTYASQREPTYVSQREASYVSQREPTYVSQREPTYMSQREPTYEPTYRSQTQMDPTYRSQTQREPTYRSHTQREPTYVEEHSIYPSMRSGLMRTALPDGDRSVARTQTSRQPTLTSRSSQMKTTTPRTARTFQGFN